jgi:hypothetical protein
MRCGTGAAVRRGHEASFSSNYIIYQGLYYLLPRTHSPLLFFGYCE